MTTLHYAKWSLSIADAYGRLFVDRFCVVVVQELLD